MTSVISGLLPHIAKDFDLSLSELEKSVQQYLLSACQSKPEAPAKEAPAKEAPAKDAPAKDAPAKKTAPAKKAPAKEPESESDSDDEPVVEKPKKKASAKEVLEDKPEPKKSKAKTEEAEEPKPKSKAKASKVEPAEDAEDDGAAVLSAADKKLLERVKKAKDAKKFYCTENCRDVGDNAQMRAKYVFYEGLGVAGIKDSEKLNHVLKLVGYDEKKTPAKDQTVKSKVQELKSKAAAEPKKSAKSKTVEKEDEPEPEPAPKKPTKSSATEKKNPKAAPVKNGFGNWVDTKTNLVFDHKTHEVIGVQDDETGAVEPLEDEHIELCKKNGWKFVKLNQDQLTKSIIEKEIEDELSSTDVDDENVEDILRNLEDANK
jgi:outer membrane biosynthesis protein TonB